MPMTRPPISAPGTDPMPPSTTMVKATSTKALPGARLDIVGRNQQAGGDGDAGSAEAESDGVDMRDVDAGEFGPKLLLGDGADRLAGVGQRHDQPQHQRHDENRHERNHPCTDKNEAEIDRLND